jgi:IS30 family transposase
VAGASVRGLTTEDLRKAKRLMDEGHSLRNAARLIGCHPNTIRYHFDPEFKKAARAQATAFQRKKLAGKKMLRSWLKLGEALDVLHAV